MRLKARYGKMKSTFKLTKPTEGYGDKRLPIKKGGAWGKYESDFSEYIFKMI